MRMQRMLRLKNGKARGALMALFTDTITIYNYYQDVLTRQDTWHRTVIKGVQWTGVRDKTVTAQGTVFTASTVDITIPIDADTEGKEYLDILLYNSGKYDISKYWTIDPISDLSVVVLGEIDKEITPIYTITNLRRDYPDVVTMASVADATNRKYLKHWEIGCK